MRDPYAALRVMLKPEPERTCIDCGKAGPSDSFPSAGHGAREPRCQPCHRVRRNELRRLRAERLSVSARGREGAG